MYYVAYILILRLSFDITMSLNSFGPLMPFHFSPVLAFVVQIVDICQDDVVGQAAVLLRVEGLLRPLRRQRHHGQHLRLGGQDLQVLCDAQPTLHVEVAGHVEH